MSYVNLTASIADPIINAAVDYSNSSNGFNRHIASRISYLFGAAISIPTTTADVLIGLVFKVASLATLRIFPQINRTASNHLRSLRDLFFKPHLCLLRTINIRAEIKVTPRQRGFISDSIRVFKERAKECKGRNDFVNKHVISRLNYAMFGVASLVTRTVDHVISKIATTFSFLTLGLVPKVNEVACRSLMYPYLIKDLFYSVEKTINPWTSSKTR